MIGAPSSIDKQDLTLPENLEAPLLSFTFFNCALVNVTSSLLQFPQQWRP
jgi:hypothetical protein